MSKYLDNTGLAHFWEKVKEKINSEIRGIYEGPIAYLQEDIDYLYNNMSGGSTFEDVSEIPENPDPQKIYRVATPQIYVYFESKLYTLKEAFALYLDLPDAFTLNTNIIFATTKPDNPIPFVSTEPYTYIVTVYVIGNDICGNMPIDLETGEMAWLKNDDLIDAADVGGYYGGVVDSLDTSTMEEGAIYLHYTYKYVNVVNGIEQVLNGGGSSNGGSSEPKLIYSKTVEFPIGSEPQDSILLDGFTPVDNMKVIIRTQPIDTSVDFTVEHYNSFSKTSLSSGGVTLVGYNSISEQLAFNTTANVMSLSSCNIAYTDGGYYLQKRKYKVDGGNFVSAVYDFQTLKSSWDNTTIEDPVKYIIEIYEIPTGGGGGGISQVFEDVAAIPENPDPQKIYRVKEPQLYVYYNSRINTAEEILELMLSADNPNMTSTGIKLFNVESLPSEPLDLVVMNTLDTGNTTIGFNIYIMNDDLYGYAHVMSDSGEWQWQWVKNEAAFEAAGMGGGVYGGVISSFDTSTMVEGDIYLHYTYKYINVANGIEYILNNNNDTNVGSSVCTIQNSMLSGYIALAIALGGHENGNPILQYTINLNDDATTLMIKDEANKILSELLSKPISSVTLEFPSSLAGEADTTFFSYSVSIFGATMFHLYGLREDSINGYIAVTTILYNAETNTVDIQDILIDASLHSVYKMTTGDNKNLQQELVSGTNIKTVNGESLLGSGNITIEGGSSSKFKILSRHTLSVNGYVDLLDYMEQYDELMIIVRAVPSAATTIGIGSTTSGSSNFLTSVSVSGTSYLKITLNRTDEDYFAWTIVGSGNNISSFGWTGSIGYQYLRNYTTGSSVDMSVVIHGR